MTRYPGDFAPIVGQPPHIALPRNPNFHPPIAVWTLLLAVAVCALHVWDTYHVFCSGAYTRASEGSFFQLRSDAFASPTFVLHIVARTVLGYIAFTPMHDASHGSIARRGWSWINNIVGYSCAGVLNFGAFSIFKWCHLLHHRYTNEKAADPDMWSGGISASSGVNLYWSQSVLLLPLRCMTQSLHYLYLALAHAHTQLSVLTFATDIAIAVVTFVAPMLLSVYAWHKYSALFFFLTLPHFASVMMLALVFDYLVHRPHSADTADKPLRATALVFLHQPRTRDRGTDLVSREDVLSSGISWLKIPTLFQCYHLMHHLFPDSPFYEYENMFWSVAGELFEHGIRGLPIFPLVVHRSCATDEPPKAKAKTATRPRSRSHSQGKKQKNAKKR